MTEEDIKFYEQYKSITKKECKQEKQELIGEFIHDIKYKDPLEILQKWEARKCV